MTTWMEKTLGSFGLIAPEISDFVEYWRAMLDQDSYYLIKLIPSDFIENNFGLDINPKPDSELRLFFAFQPISEKYPANGPIINNFERIGFSVVEWGGVILEEN